MVIETSHDYFSQLNKIEREIYINEQLSARDTIKLKDIDGVKVFGVEAIEARLNALKALARYGELLVDLANSEASDRLVQEAKGLDNIIVNLDAKIKKIEDGEPDEKFKANVGLVTTVFGEVAGYVIEKEIEKALDAAINKGENPVTDLIAGLSSDLIIAYERRRSMISDMRTKRVDAYNREIAKGSDADAGKLALYAERIKEHEDIWEQFPGSNPEASMDSMIDAHRALVDYAKSDKKPKDFSDLVEAMEVFASRAERIAAAIEAINAEKGDNP